MILHVRRRPRILRRDPTALFPSSELRARELCPVIQAGHIAVRLILMVALDLGLIGYLIDGVILLDRVLTMATSSAIVLVNGK